LADAGDARADQGLVTDKLEGEAGQDRRESREPRPLCRLPNGRGRHPTANVPGDFAAHRGTAAAATTSASMRRSTVMHSRATDGMSASERQGKRPDQAVKHRSDDWECREPSTLSHLGFQPVQKMPTIHVSSGFIWGIPVMETKGHARGARRVEGTGITDLIPACGDIDSCAHAPCQSKAPISHWTAGRFCDGCLGGGAGSMSQGLRVLVLALTSGAKADIS